jgi:hypothetical protein
MQEALDFQVSTGNAPRGSRICDEEFHTRAGEALSARWIFGLYALDFAAL